MLLCILSRGLRGQCSLLGAPLAPKTEELSPNHEHTPAEGDGAPAFLTFDSALSAGKPPVAKRPRMTSNLPVRSRVEPRYDKKVTRVSDTRERGMMILLLQEY